MNALRLVCFLMPVSFVSCEPAAKPATAISPIDGKSDSANGTVTVSIDGCEAAPKEEEALKQLAKSMVSDAIHDAINEVVQEMVKKLDISDPIETDLFSEVFGTDIPGSDALISVCLIRPASEAKEPRTIVLSREGKSFIRYTRAAAPVERPLEIMNIACMKDGHITQAEKILDYIDGTWKQLNINVRNEISK